MFKKLKSFLLEKTEGVAAVEFAVLAPVFFATMSAVFEITYFAYTSASIQRAVEDAIDSIRTGHVYTVMLSNGWNPEEWYRNEICSNISVPNCMTELQIRVQSFDNEFDIYKDSTNTGTIDVGSSGTLMRVEAKIEMPKLFVTAVVFTQDDIMATAGLTFMTEPY